MPARGPLTAHRYVGLAGSATLAGGALQVGALPGLAVGDGLPGLAQAPGILAGLIGLVVLTAAWWRVGADTADGPALDGRWMVLTAALWALPLLLAPPLASRDAFAYACQGAVFNAGLDPHSTGPAALPCPWLDSVPPVWRDAASPYGPLATLLAAVAAGAGTAFGRVEAAVDVLRLGAVLGVVLAAWCGRRLALAGGVSAARAAWLGLAGPVVAVHAIGGAHVDALMTGLVVAAAAAALGRADGAAAPVWRAAAAGLLLGLAVAVKATALVALPFLALLVLSRAGGGGGDEGAYSPAGPARRWRSLAGALATVAGAAATGYGVLAVASGLGVGFVRGLARTADLVQWTSVPTAMGMTAGYALRAVGVDAGFDAAVAAARALGLIAASAVGAAAWWWAWRAPAGRTGEDRARATLAATGVAFAAVALLGPVFYPWYALTPLAFLAVSTQDRRAQAWLGAASAPLAFLILPNGVGLAPRTKLPGAVAVTAAVSATLTVTASRARRGVPTRSRTTGS